MLTLTLPAAQPLIKAGDKEVLVVTNADLRESANVACWRGGAEQVRGQARKSAGRPLWHPDQARSPVQGRQGPGFISSQREGSDLFATIDPQAPVIVLLTAWQYSHHLAPSLATHKGPVLLLANFDGTWPGLVGMLCMAGTLTSLGKTYSRLWSSDFDDEFSSRAGVLAEDPEPSSTTPRTCIRSTPRTP